MASGARTQGSVRCLSLTSLRGGGLLAAVGSCGADSSSLWHPQRRTEGVCPVLLRYRGGSLVRELLFTPTMLLLQHNSQFPVLRTSHDLHNKVPPTHHAQKMNTAPAVGSCGADSSSLWHPQRTEAVCPVLLRYRGGSLVRELLFTPLCCCYSTAASFRSFGHHMTTTTKFLPHNTPRR